jgi:LysR family glycine cleavage system transcriptional activator
MGKFYGAKEILSECKMKLPPLNALRVFEVAARKGSFVAAGEDLGVSSAAVSLQVRNLEDWLGRQLFFRRNNQIRLTDAGEDLYRNAAQSLADIAAFTQSVQQTAVHKSVVLSAVPSVAERWLPGVAAAWQSTYPLKIISAEDPLDLERMGIDVHISFGQGHYADYVQTPLFQDEVVPMAAPDWAIKCGDLVAAQLIEIDWGRSFTRAPKWATWFTEKGLPARDGHPAFTASGTSLALSMAEQGLGVVLGQRRLALGALKHGRLIIQDDHAMPLTSAYYAISANHNAKNRRIQALIQLLQKMAG